MERFTEEEWETFTHIYDHGVESYKLDVPDYDVDMLERIRDKLYQLAPSPPINRQYVIHLVDRRGRTVAQFGMAVDHNGEIEILPVEGFSKAEIEEESC